MAIASKINGDLQRVSILDSLGTTDSPIYTSPITATFTGKFDPVAFQVVVSELNGTITIGDLISGAYIPQGSVVAGYAAPNLTITTPVGEPMPWATISNVAVINGGNLTVSMATANVTGVYTANKAVQSGGPRLDYYTITNSIPNKHPQTVELIQKRATVHVYQIVDDVEMHVGFYPSGVYGSNAAQVQTSLNAEAVLSGLSYTVAVVDGATFNT